MVPKPSQLVLQREGSFQEARKREWHSQSILEREHSEEVRGYSRDCRTGASGPRMGLGNLEELFWIIE